jgi:uncharacterized protein YjbI with pentapeptide repeats
MAYQSHLEILQQGVEAWNAWREQNPTIVPALANADLTGMVLSQVGISGANLSGADLSGANLSRVNLSRANLSGATLDWANLSEATLNFAHLPGAGLQKATLSGADLARADFTGADLSMANLQGTKSHGAMFTEANLQWGTNFTGADLSSASLSRASLFRTIFTRANLSMASFRETDPRQVTFSELNLSRANFTEAKLSFQNFSGADLSGATFYHADLHQADLRRSTLVKTSFKGANLEGCNVFGVSAWGLELEGANQKNLSLTDTDAGDPAIKVDDLEVAQFFYLILNNAKIRQVIDTITSKVVLILGRFTSERKAVLDAIRDELRQHGYLPILFDFEKPAGRDLTETISTLAHMARFIIADITDAKSIPQELQAIVPNLPSVPVQPLVLATEYEYRMFEHFKRYPWVLEVYRYDDEDQVITSLEAKVISPAEAKVKELTS